MLQICENIRQARKAAHKTQEEMANELNVPRTTYANWEKETEPGFTILKSISQILGVELGELVNSEISVGTKKNIINELKVRVQILTLELVKLMSKAYKKNSTKVSLELENLMQEEIARLNKEL